MQVALIGADTPTGLEVRRLFAQWGRHNSLDVGLSASRFRSERQAKKVARRGSPQVLVDLRLASLLAAGSDIDAADVERCRWLAKACERSDILYVLLSSDQVFSGAVHKPLRESDSVDAIDSIGLAFILAEQSVREASPSACVLRTGPIFASAADELLSGALSTLTESRHVNLDDTDYFCPSGAADVARVVTAILDQASVGADASGIFHYSSTDRTTRYGFAEVLLASAGQFADLGDVTLQALAADTTASSRMLDCNRIRECFAIKQLPWRGQINQAVKAYFLEP